MDNTHIKKTVGLIFRKEKLERSGFYGLPEYAIQLGIKIVFLDLNEPIANQGHFDLIVHKITDVVGKMHRGDEISAAQFDNFLRFCESHPKVIIMDTWENVEKVINRSKLHWLLEKSIEFKPPQNKGQLFSVPKSISLESFDMRSEALNMKFPIICKRSKACASVSSHQMTIIPTLNAMSKVTGYGKNEQVILQEFIQHGGILIKVYVLDKHVYPALRPSFKDLNQNCDVFHFDSQILPKSFHSSSKLLNGLDKVMSISNEDVEKRIYETLDYDRLEKIADVLRHQIGLTFFGFDVILEAKTNNHYLVDVNYFPSFSNVPKFHEIFVSILLQKLNNP